jgi:predicted DNA-binding transcriptional regulator AlpA
MHHLVGMAEIAEILGVTRQRVAQLIESYEDFPKPEVELSGGRVWSRTAIESWLASHPERGPGRPEEGVERKGFFGRHFGGLFTRFTDRARNAVVRAQEEARLLNHNYIGTEHLLLGLIVIAEGLAFETLYALGVTHDKVKDQIAEMVGRGSETPQGNIPFTPRAKKVLELGLREALQLGHNYIGTEHVLLGILREKDGVGWKALEALGLDRTKTRGAVISMMQGVPLTAPGAPPVTHSPVCSFCGKPREQVGQLIAGPEAIAICDGCVRDSMQIIEDSGQATTLEMRLSLLEQRLAKLESDDKA